jgi:hypothetical protein
MWGRQRSGRWPRARTEGRYREGTGKVQGRYREQRAVAAGAHRGHVPNVVVERLVLEHDPLADRELQHALVPNDRRVPAVISPPRRDDMHAAAISGI